MTVEMTKSLFRIVVRSKAQLLFEAVTSPGRWFESEFLMA
jgi:hypothetical protein